MLSLYKMFSAHICENQLLMDSYPTMPFIREILNWVLICPPDSQFRCHLCTDGGGQRYDLLTGTGYTDTLFLIYYIINNLKYNQ